MRRSGGRDGKAGKAGKTGTAAPSARRPSPRTDIAVEEEVDLHGLTVNEAMVAAELALKRHARSPGAVLRFVHGHSSGTIGSIKGALKRNLETIWRGRIQGCRPEPGNPGATLVKLAKT